MNNPFKATALPLFDSTDLAAAALGDDVSKRLGYFVTHDSGAYRLHDYTHVTNFAPRLDPAATLGSFRAPEVPRLGPVGLPGSGADLLHRDVTPNVLIAQSLGTGMAIVSDFVAAMGRRYAVAFVDETGFYGKLVAQKWTCNPYGETYYRSSGGPCPIHDDGTLTPSSA